MNLQDTGPWLAFAVLLVVVVASVRQLRAPRRRPLLQVAILALQGVAGVLLYCVLHPPSRPLADNGQVIHLADASMSRDDMAGEGAPLLLPEADAVAGGTRVPDLATALRQHPTSRLTLVGAGLAARDRDAQLPVAVRWLPAPTLQGWTHLQLPAAVAPGARFELQAQAYLPAGEGQAELLDPAGRVIDRAALDEAGRVQLSGVARAAGRSVFQLRLLGRDGRLLDSTPVPQQTVAAPTLHVQMRAGAPGAELKYLRRWATDSGIDLHVQTDTGAGMHLGDGAAALDAAALARSDLLLLDERSLASLGAGPFAAVRDALHGGMGVLVRLTGPPTAAARQRLRELGLAVQGDAGSGAVALPADAEPALLQARRGPSAAAALPTAEGLDADRSSRGAALPALEQLSLQAADAHALLRDAQGHAVGGWQAAGSGRIGLLPITDSWRWVLAGRDDRHAELWSSVVATLARAQAAPDPLWSPHALSWAGERQLLCGATAPLQSLADDGTATPLPIDPQSGPARCAAWWPQAAGWQRLQLGERHLWRYVFDPATAGPLHRQSLADATAAALATRPASGTAARVQTAGSRWPWWWAFLLCAGVLWWLERRRG